MIVLVIWRELGTFWSYLICNIECSKKATRNGLEIKPKGHEKKNTLFDKNQLLCFDPNSIHFNGMFGFKIGRAVAEILIF